ncbi:hypothetical protein HOK00_06720 [bacterium]|jgi:predicted RNA binding protein YcfA (HicA-like mRNA interferase family)|nr:hypothetical protein [bacterium]
MNRDIKKMLEPFLKKGWFLDRVNKHSIFKHPKGGCVTVSNTASDTNAVKQIKKDFINEEKKHSHNEK